MSTMTWKEYLRTEILWCCFFSDAIAAVWNCCSLHLLLLPHQMLLLLSLLLQMAKYMQNNRAPTLETCSLKLNNIQKNKKLLLFLLLLLFSVLDRCFQKLQNSTFTYIFYVTCTLIRTPIRFVCESLKKFFSGCPPNWHRKKINIVLRAIQINKCLLLLFILITLHSHTF